MGFVRFRICFAGVLLVLLLSPVSAQAPPQEKECLAYAYTESENHYFLMKNNSSIFGSKVFVEHNCDELEIHLNGQFYISSNNNFDFVIDPGISNFTFFMDDNKSIIYENVVFYPERLNWEFDYEMLESQKPTFIEMAKADVEMNWAVSFSIVIVWVLSTYVYWSLINNYTQRTFVEEVTQ